jgi:hypothetical protein
MAEQYLDSLLPDDQMRARLQGGQALLFKVAKWQEIERQIERLGFGEQYFVTQVSAKRGKLTKVAPIVDY